MPSEYFSLMAQYGIVGIVLSVCMWWVYTRDKEVRKDMKAKNEDHMKEVIALQSSHREERRELVLTLTSQHKEALESSRDVATALRASAVAMTDLSTLIRDRQ